VKKSQPNPPPPNRALLRRLGAALERSRSTLVPPSFMWLWEAPRYAIAYGGRNSAKSWSIARTLLVQAHEKPERVLCAREVQSSMRESAYRLLCDQIHLLGLDDFYRIGADAINGRNGSQFIFEGLFRNASRLRSLEGITITWVEEAQSVCQQSWEDLLPTVLRRRGSRLIVSFNPQAKDDPVSRLFVHNPRPGSIVRKSTYQDNPFFSPEAEAERAWLEKVDPDAHRHVWLGFPKEISDALVLKGRYFVESFTVSDAWAGPFFGLDFGFSSDPTAAIKCYIDDTTVPWTLYIAQEYWALGTEIDALPGALAAAVPGIARHTVFADSARPETISYLVKHGLSSVVPVEKWSGSVNDGIAYLRTFRIVIDPGCKHFLDEAQSYSFKVDRLTGVPLPEPLDKFNHLIDSLRYALAPLIRRQPSMSFFSRNALLVDGEPVSPPPSAGRPIRIFATVGISEHTGSVGVAFFVHSPAHGWPLTLVDYTMSTLQETFSGQWLRGVLERAQELRAEWNAVEFKTCVWLEQGRAFETLALVAEEVILTPGFSRYDLGQIESQLLPVSLDERAAQIRQVINTGGCLKLAQSAWLRQVTHRSVTSNHLLSQLLGYSPDARDAARELVMAVCLAVLAPAGRVEWGMPQVDPAVVAEVKAESPPPAPPAPAVADAPAAVAVAPVPAPIIGSGVMLKPGLHTINGTPISVPRDGNKDETFWPLRPGKYSIDNVLVWVRRPGGGLQIAV
jgi:phage terminase large subunit